MDEKLRPYNVKAVTWVEQEFEKLVKAEDPYDAERRFMKENPNSRVVEVDNVIRQEDFIRYIVRDGIKTKSDSELLQCSIHIMATFSIDDVRAHLLLANKIRKDLDNDMELPELESRIVRYAVEVCKEYSKMCKPYMTERDKFVK